MRKNILITGIPKSGKSSLLHEVLSTVPQKVGLLTRELKSDGSRVGFQIESSSGEKSILAHANLESPYKVSKYFVNVENLRSVIQRMPIIQQDDVIYIDEIGEMQLLSTEFKELINSFFNYTNSFVTTISCIFQDDFIEDIKRRDDIFLLQVSHETFVQDKEFIIQLLRKIEKAKLYISEPERFSKKGDFVYLKSDHATRRLRSIGGIWYCSCDFHKKKNICSHTIAVEERYKPNLRHISILT